MFTGIIEEVGTVKLLLQQGETTQIVISAKEVLKGTKLGDSIAVNGVCLTVTKFSADGFCADVMGETLRRSSLGTLKKGSKVNLERAMAADGRFGGHIVSGHIDGTGEVASVSPEGNAVWYRILAPQKILNGIVAEVTEQDFSVSIIPHTGANTILSLKQKGDIVNLENDVIGKYVQKMLGKKEEKKESRITEEFLGTYGFL